jgi:hypothetical protein
MYFFDNKDKKEKNVKVPLVLPSTFWYFTSTVANLLILKSVSAMSNIIFIGPQQKLIPHHHQQQKKTIFTTVISICLYYGAKTIENFSDPNRTRLIPHVGPTRHMFLEVDRV